MEPISCRVSSFCKPLSQQNQCKVRGKHSLRQPKLITPEAKPVVETPSAVEAASVPMPQKPIDVPNVGQKTTDEKPTPAIQTNTENSLRKDQEVPKMGLAESSKKHEDGIRSPWCDFFE
ncbi:unnamed protein product [Lactuca saligna]|uniref:Uncharacterized protein n=1 Tax=Lactuca saligna TaxID=75948 RepID=A0AA35ZN92_LACSI|nr:unnamed protein product [Lactuca saligna]